MDPMISHNSMEHMRTQSNNLVQQTFSKGILVSVAVVKHHDKKLLRKEIIHSLQGIVHH